MSQKIPIWIQRISKIHVLCKTNCEYCGERGAKSCAGWRAISKKFWSLLRHLDAWKPQGQPFLQEVYFWPIKGSRAPTLLIVWVYSVYLNFFSLNSRYVADNLSHLRKCTELIIFEVEWVFLHFGGWITTKYHNFTLHPLDNIQSCCDVFERSLILLSFPFLHRSYSGQQPLFPFVRNF